MSPVFVDTSAVIAFLNPDDTNHSSAEKTFRGLSSRSVGLITTSFVLVEIYALLSHRMGVEAVRRFRADFSLLLEVVWVDAELHEAGLDLLLEKNIRDLSLVDAVSFLVMRQRKLDEVFAFDRHFKQHGFRTIP